MECSCDIIIDTSDSEADFIVEKIRKSRINHKCCECREQINIGEEYEHAKCCWDGDITTYKTCLSCVSVREMMFPAGWSYEMMWEDVSDFISDNGGLNESCLSKTHPKAREKMCEMIEKEWLIDDETEN